MGKNRDNKSREQELDELRMAEWQVLQSACSCRACAHQVQEIRHSGSFTWDPKKCATASPGKGNW